MPFYWLAVRPWVNDMKKVACIEIGGSGGANKKNRKIMDLSDVRSVNDLMNKKTIPIKNITYRWVPGDNNNGGSVAPGEEDDPYRDETLGETLERQRQARKAHKNKHRTQYRRTSKGALVPVRQPEKTSRSQAASQKQTQKLTTTNPAKSGIPSQSQSQPQSPQRPVNTRTTNISTRPPSISSFDADPAVEQQHQGLPLKTADKHEETLSLNNLDEEREQLGHLRVTKWEREEEENENDAAQAHENSSRLEDVLDDYTALLASNNDNDNERQDVLLYDDDDSMSHVSDLTAESSSFLWIPCTSLPPKGIQPQEQAVLPSRHSNNKYKYQTSASVLKSCMKVKTLKESLVSKQQRNLQSSSRRGRQDSAPAVPLRSQSFTSVDVARSLNNESSNIGDDEDATESDICPIAELSLVSSRRSSCSSSSSDSKDDEKNDDAGSDNFYDFFTAMFNGEIEGVSPPVYNLEPPERELHWGHVEIREYSICLGDNPACAQGPPIQLDWNYHAMNNWTLDHFEQHEQEKEEKTLRRLSSRWRQELLLELGYTHAQIKAVVVDKLRHQKRRIHTVSRLKYMKFDERVEKIVRVFPKT